MKNIESRWRIKKLMKFTQFLKRIKKHMKILELHQRIMKTMQIFEFQQNKKNHENPGILRGNHETSKS